MRQPVSSPVAQKFLMNPFTVLNSRDGEWQDRKRAWKAIGLKSEIGRGADIGGNAQTVGGLQLQDAIRLREKQHLTYTGKAASFDAYRVKEGTRESTDEQGTSIFDPVLCELAYRWWSNESAQILDPFAGGSVRGIVASHLGRKYWGCDLRAEQIEANRTQGAALCEGKPMPEWVCGDSLYTTDDAPEADFVFSCPPYGDLEVYSDKPDDLSAMDWPEFQTAYRVIIAKACAKLRQDRFACFVVGDFRDGKGNYRNFVSETIAAFLDAGLSLYNEAILVTSVGSASMRVTRQFNACRKLCKTHQNVLVFVKGDGRKAADNCKS